MIEGRRLNELGVLLSSSRSNSTWDILLDRGRADLGLAMAALLPFAAEPRTGLLPSRLPGLIAREETLRELRECRGVSRPSRYPLAWPVRLDEGVDGVDDPEKMIGGVVHVLCRRAPGLRLLEAYASLDRTSFPAISLTRMAGSFSMFRIESRRP